MPTNTLTSLAILKVNIDQGKDYLDYLRPFILQVLVEHDIDPITDSVVSRYLREQFGLEIPKRTIEIVLKRISKRHAIKRDYGVYRRTGALPDPQLAHKQADAERHIESVVNGLREFSQGTISPIDSDERAVAAVCAFLTEFDVTCLRAYLRGTAIPSIEDSHETDIVLVSKYVQQVSRADPARFDSFIVLVQGHMLANALMCPDLLNASKTYKDVTFYFDTPLLVRRLRAEGEAKQAATIELIALLGKLGGRVAAFSHSRQELRRVLQGAADFLESPAGRGPIVHEARRRGTSRSDLLLLAESIDDKLSEASIQIEVTPPYVEDFQIDEMIFEQVLDDEIFYYNPRAREYDINSVRSVYVIRGNKPALSLEKSKSVFVTSNSAFAKAAWEYGQQYESSQDVSSVITDFSLANMAWLKAPMGAPTIPTTQLLAFSYAAVEPSSKLLSKYLSEIDKLEREGTITERDHQLLRSSPLVNEELMNLTLGEDEALTTETITETLEHVSTEIRKEELERLTLEQEAHLDTRDLLNSELSRNQSIVGNLYWRCRGRARTCAWALSICTSGLLFVGLLSGLGLRSAIPIVSWGLILSSLALALLALLNLVFGSNVKKLHEWVENKCLTWFLKREAKVVGIDLNEFDIDASDTNRPTFQGMR